LKAKTSVHSIFSLRNDSRCALGQNFTAWLNETLERLLSVKKLKEMYSDMPDSSNPTQFLDNALKTLKIRYAIHPEDLSSIPTTGTTVVVANHPFGGIDGMILASVLCSARKDVKILVNYMLGAVPELHPLFILSDPFQGKTSIHTNQIALRTSIRWLKNAGMLVIFPSGVVSHFCWQNRKIEDPQWNSSLARLIRLTKAPVLPVYFKGRNSLFFQVAGLIHPLLRTAMLPKEMSKKQNKQIHLKLGNLIPYKMLATIDNDEHLMAYLRFRTYLLGNAFGESPGFFSYNERIRRKRKAREPIIAPPKTQDLAQEVASLPDEQLLAADKDYLVYMAYAEQIPKSLREIGYLRERTFREVGEGTGKSFDLDRFDRYYTHLFVWNRGQNQIIGAYRLGLIDKIIRKFNKNGLYTYTLFNYQDLLLRRLGPALELSRSFIRKEYQKKYMPLLLLWKGIGQFVVLNPHYNTLFGAVSISGEYKPYSRRLIAAFLKNNGFFSELSEFVNSRNPLRKKDMPELERTKSRYWPGNIEELSSWIAGIETDGKGVPILLKQYLKLGGKLLGFNIDPSFGNVLDGLIMVDLTQTEPKLLKRYMGLKGFEVFASYHNILDLKFSLASHIPSKAFAGL
jgi:putative hemolysin